MQTIQKARILAAQRSTSISEQAYESSRRTAMRLMEQGFRLGGAPLARRDVLHER